MIRTIQPDLDDNTSMWAATCRQAEPHPPLAGDIAADVVIIGAGFTGISTAYQLAARYPDRKIVVLEAKRVGNGASGRNGGMALNWINGVEAKDPDKARRVFHATKAGLDWIARVIDEHRLSVRFHRIGCLEAYTEARRAEHAHAKTERLASWGIPVRWLAGDDLKEHLRAEGVLGAVLDPTAGQLHGLDLLQGLCEVLVERGVALHEASPVVRIDEGKTHRVTTPGGSVRAPWMVLATNGYTGRLGYFRHGVFPLHSHVVSTAPLPLTRWREMGWGHTAGFTDDLDRIAYASMSEDGRLLFGGGGNLAYSYLYGNRTAWPRPGDGPEHAFVRAMLNRYFPDAAQVPLAHQWTGTLGITMSRVCSMGITGAHRNVLYALGYSGHGVVLANLAGQVLCDLYSDHPEPWRDLPFYERPLTGIPGEPLRWMGYQMYTRLTGRSPRRYEAD